MWYVIQVINGREDVMRERIERVVPASAMQELFYPQFQTEIKVRGEWVNTTKPLFPGYLICDTADPRTVQQHLLRMDDFARVLSQDGQFVPLAKEDVQLIGGFTLVKKLLEETDDVIVGLDNLNNYYDPGIKDARLRMLAEADPESRFTFVRGDLCDAALIERLFAENGFDVVVNLAAQAGVRYSIENPRAYLESNLVGFFNVLEACRRHPVRHLVYASSSSVYGGNKKVPFSEEDRVDSPVSLYAATKKSNELMAAAYSKLYSIPATGLRFFTVYGPMGRPDMAYFGFTEKLRRGETIKIFNMGDCRRDFTYVDDIVEGVRRVMESAPEVKMGEDGLPLAAHRVYNIGNSHPENLLDFVDTLQRVLVEEGVLPADYDFEAHKQLVPMQPGDVPVTYADTTALKRDLGYKPSTPLEDGLRAFAKWYKRYYNI